MKESVTGAPEIIGPVVRMCTAACYGVYACRHVDRSRTFMALADKISPSMGDDEVCAHFAYQLALSGASDSNGVLHMIPDGCEFTVHRERLPDTRTGQVVYTAVYSGGLPRDEVLVSAPPYDAAEAAIRARLMRERRNAAVVPVPGSPGHHDEVCR